MTGQEIADALARFPFALLLVATALSVALVLLLIPLAHRLGWVDKPSGRKKHVGVIPLIGGWTLLLVTGLMQAAFPEGRQAPAGYWVGALLLFAVAVIDDRHPIRARYRFMVQLAAAVAGVSLGGQILTGVGDLFGLGVWSSIWLGMLISIVGTVAVVNAVNFTDGADGLCAGLGFVGLGWFAVALMLAGFGAVEAGEIAASHASGMLPLAATAMGALAGFLVFNLRSPWRARASVFLGDSGSMLIGFMLAWFAIHAATAFGGRSVPPVVCLWIVALPLADSAAVIARRVLAGIKPMQADLKHLHHLLPRFGFTVGQSVAIIHAAAFTCGLVGVGGWLLGVREHWLFALFVAAMIGFVVWTRACWLRLDSKPRVDLAADARRDGAGLRGN